jgi:hypothetical protein
MPATPTIEQRVEKLEAEVAELKRLSVVENKSDWLSTVAGSFRDDPDFAEIVQFGREIREADRRQSGE